jgi:hypothetical protein
MVAHKTAFNVVNNKIAVMGRVLCGILNCFLSEPEINQTNKQTNICINCVAEYNKRMRGEGKSKPRLDR